MRIKQIMNQSILILSVGGDNTYSKKKFKEKKNKSGRRSEECKRSVKSQIKERDRVNRYREKKGKKFKEFKKEDDRIQEIFESEYNCIRRMKKCFSKEQINTYIKQSKVELTKYYCKKCNAWHLTSSITRRV